MRAPAQHTISTKSGWISRVRGHAFIRRALSPKPEPVAPEQQMLDGDRLNTERMGRAEILINSTSYLRLDELSEVSVINSSLTEASFELHYGVFLIQAGVPSAFPWANLSRSRTAGSIGKIPAFEMVTPYGPLTIRKNGICQIIIDRLGTKIEVFDGEVALGGRNEALGNKAKVLKSGIRWIWRGGHPAQSTALRWRGFDQIDSWGFPLVRHGIIRREEGEIFASVVQDPSGEFGVPLEFQFRDGMFLSTRQASYLELMLNRGTFLRLGPSTRIRAVPAETEEAVFELMSGAIIIDSDPMFPYAMRPTRIITPRGAFSIKPNSFVRIDVEPGETAISVQSGGVEGAARIGSGKRLRYSGSAPPLEESVARKENPSDAFDRWSASLSHAGNLTFFEGHITLERKGGAKLELADSPPGLQPQLLEGGHLLTGQDGRAVLILGGFMIHVDRHSELVAVNASPRETEVALSSGAAIFYVGEPQTIYARTNLTVTTPHGRTRISGPGIFRFDVDASGTRIRTRSGTLLAGSLDGKSKFKVKEKQSVRLQDGGQAPQIVRLADTPDDFDQWSIGTREFPFRQGIRRNR
jgi:ferric-dicitrate binding protein FerR (iron transport regulator)